MEFLSIEINQMSETYIEFVQYKTIIPEQMENPDGMIEIGKEITYLQNKTIFPIVKMNIQTICEPISNDRDQIKFQEVPSEKSASRIDQFQIESFSDVEYIAIILSMSNLNSFALPKYTENEIIKGDDVQYIKTPNQFIWFGEKMEFEQVLNNLTKLTR